MGKLVPTKPTFQKLFQHLRDEHYNLKKLHSSFDNLVYEILQQLTVWENASGKHSQIQTQRRQLVMHMLSKHIGLPLIDINALLARKSIGVIGELAFAGAQICPYCHKEK